MRGLGLLWLCNSECKAGGLSRLYPAIYNLAISSLKFRVCYGSQGVDSRRKPLPGNDLKHFGDLD